ncbi:MAG TPA: hypothetical protein VM638_03640 [Actinomycetota bacterium]|nr:hypothetical protein [Actinomycetota bacterium]
MTIKTRRVVLALAGLMALTGAAAAQPTVAITAPADGSTISRSATPQIAVSGQSAFEEPVPTGRNLYLRWDGTDDSCGATYLSDNNGPDEGNGCAFVAGIASVTPDEDDFTVSYSSGAEVATPITIDATRRITGTMGYVHAAPDAPIFDIEVLFDDQVVGRQRYNPGPQVGLFARRQFNLDIPIPQSWHQKDVSSVTLNWHFQQSLSVASTWVEHENPVSFMRLPTYSASFSRKVEVQLNNGSWQPATLSQDLTTWTRAVNAPAANGPAVIRARAVQGGSTSGVSQISVTIEP